VRDVRADNYLQKIVIVSLIVTVTWSIMCIKLNVSRNVCPGLIV
jgi:hypothetical protein